jgi:photosystem II stability/assembly factor-like uncharacterized protein
MTVAASPARAGLVWAGADPSAVWRSADGGGTWNQCEGLLTLPSAPTWAFPPKPKTHHVRWLLPHPSDPDQLCVAIEAGALVRTRDGGATWVDRVPGGPYDTHELAAHPAEPGHLRSAAGDGYFESVDGGDTWVSPMKGLDVRYLRSVAIDPADPTVTLVSGASGPRSAYVAGRSDGRVYRRVASGAWSGLGHWSESARTIAPLLIAGRDGGEFWAADERGVHFSMDGGLHWKQRGAFARPPDHLRGVALVG